MTPDHWHQIELVLDAVLEHEPGQWDAVLDETCAADPELRREVEALLQCFPEAECFLETPAAALLTEAGALPSPVEGQMIGPYRLVREIGRGGMGYVFLAERADDQFTQQAALKVLRQGFLEEHTARFRAERQILASLQHPNIARLLDGGLHDGTPYLVMEYIDGQPITDYCDGQCLSIDQRLDLFSQVCRAVHFAHRNLIVHRDLKPSNILVTDEDGLPQVKLLDFGIAKLLDEDSAFTIALTRSGARLMTPEYASPEQVRGETITTAADVYQLGVLLYELLTGRRPYRLERRKLHAVAEAILEEEPARPSVVLTQVERLVEPEVTPERVSRLRGTVLERLRRRLAGDLDVICLKALRKEPERRYDSAASLGEDVRRHLAGLPVEARGDPLGYRVRKFVQRHRWGVGAAVVFVLMVTGYALTVTLQADQVRQALGQARLETGKSQQVTEFLMGLFEANDPAEALGDTVTARELLERGVEQAEALNSQPELQAQMLDVMGRVYQSLGRYDEAQPLLERALEVRRALMGQEHPDVATSLNNWASLLYVKGDYNAAEPLLREALAMRQKLLGQEHLDTAESMGNLAALLFSKGDYEAAEALYREALAIRRKLLGEDHSDTATSLTSLAVLLHQSKNYEAAEALYREALAIRRKLFGEDHPDIAYNLHHLALLLYQRGDYEAAEPLYREVLAMQRRLLGEEHPAIAPVLVHMAFLERARGDDAAAEPLFREALAMQRKLLGNENSSTSETLNGLAMLLQKKGDYEAAEPLHREALALLRKQLGEKHPFVATSLSNLAYLMGQQGKPAAAEALYREALVIRRKRLGEEHPDVALSLVGLSRVLIEQQRSVEAEPLLREAIEIRRKALPVGHWLTAQAESALGACLTALGRYEEAEPLLVEGYVALKDARGEQDRNTQDAIQHLVAFYEAVGKPDQVVVYRTQLTSPAQ